MASNNPSLGALVQLSDWLLFSSIASSTRASYNSAWRSYFKFCMLYGLQPLPAPANYVLLWIAFLFYRGLQGGSIKKYVMALSSLHNEYGLLNSIRGNSQITRCLTGVLNKRPQSMLKPKLPVTPSLLWAIAPLLNMDLMDDALIWVAFTFGTFGLLRNGEIAGSGQHPATLRSLKHAEFLTPCGLPAVWYHLSRTKTHQRDGEDILIGSSVAVAALYRYLRLRRQHHQLTGASTLFCWSNGSPLTRNDIHTHACRLFSLVGVSPSSYRGVSFRAGGATALTDAGVPLEHIRLIGRWKSNAYRCYVRSSPTSLVDSIARINPQ